MTEEICVLKTQVILKIPKISIEKIFKSALKKEIRLKIEKRKICKVGYEIPKIFLENFSEIYMDNRGLVLTYINNP